MLHELLKKSRQELGVTPHQMADLIRIDYSIYKFLEYGEPLWDTSNLERKVKEIVERYRKNNSID